MTEPLLSKKMFPATLLLEGRPCLIVGGGRVAARKGAKLAAAGALVTVVAPLIKESVRAISGIRLIERPFTADDLNGSFLVFALTNDAAVNRQVVELCRQKRILCSAADGNWPDGDLILPASFDADGLTVAVGTAGRSCPPVRGRPRTGMRLFLTKTQSCTTAFRVKTLFLPISRGAYPRRPKSDFLSDVS